MLLFLLNVGFIPTVFCQVDRSTYANGSNFAETVNDDCKINIGETIKLTEKDITWDLSATCETTTIKFQLFDRWGETVAEVNSVTCSELIPILNVALDRNKITEGVYIFRTTITFAKSDDPAQLSGSVTILR